MEQGAQLCSALVAEGGLKPCMCFRPVRAARYDLDSQRKTIAFIGTDWPVGVKANAHALEDALRNLIENPVVPAPAGTEVTVTAPAYQLKAQGGGDIPLNKINE